MSDNIYNVDKNSLAFLFTEDLYIIPDKESRSKEHKAIPAVAEEKVEPLKITETVTKNEPEKKTPSIPKIPTPATSKEYCILINTPKEMEVGNEFLGKILGAIKLDLNKVDLHSSEDAFNKILSTSDYKCIIAFGLDTEKYQQVLNKVVKKDKSLILFTHSLSNLEKDVEKKKALWAALKQLS